MLSAYQFNFNTQAGTRLMSDMNLKHQMTENGYLDVRCCMIFYTVEKGSEKQSWCLPNNSQYQISNSQNQWEPLEATGHLCSSTQDQMCLELNFSWNPRKPHFVPFLELVRSWTCSPSTVKSELLWVSFQQLSNSRSKQKRSNCLQRLRKLRCCQVTLNFISHTAPGFPP